MTLYILHLVFYSFFTYLKYEGRDWMVVLYVKKEKQLKKMMKL